MRPYSEPVVRRSKKSTGLGLVVYSGLPLMILMLRLPRPAFPMTWVGLKIMGPFWLKIILRHLIFRGTKKKGALIVGTAHVAVAAFIGRGLAFKSWPLIFQGVVDLNVEGRP